MLVESWLQIFVTDFCDGEEELRILHSSWMLMKAAAPWVESLCYASGEPAPDFCDGEEELRILVVG